MNIPGDLLERLRIVETHDPHNKIAAFDLDNTLLIGDCGDAVFNRLKADELKTPLRIDNRRIPVTWDDYYDVLLEKGKITAYPMMVRSLANIPVEKIKEASYRMFFSKEKSIEIEGVDIRVPTPHPVMQDVVSYLKSRGFDIYIISATIQYTVEVAAKEFFGIPGDHVLGMIPRLRRHDVFGDVTEDEIAGPITVADGKIDAYRALAGNTSPLITAGDSITDLNILNLTHPSGLIIWVDDGNTEKRPEIIQKIAHPGNLYFLKR